MKVNEIIKARRLELGISADELAKAIGKNRATIYRYENTDIESMPVSVLEPIAKALHTTPATLMGWDEKVNTEHTGEEEHLLSSFQSLNEDGQELAIDYVDSLAEKPKYLKKKDSEASA